MIRAAAAAVAALMALTGCSVSSTGQEASDRLPDATLQSLDEGPPVALRDLRGPMVINLWASWCTPCRKELPEYEAFSRKYAGKVDVVGIDFQETRPDAALRLAEETGLTFPLYGDPDGRMRAIGLPKLILLDADGKVAHEAYLKITSVGQLEDLVRTHLGVGE
jgi:thiol-disulfide isomerase/thioredoxin